MVRALKPALALSLMAILATGCGQTQNGAARVASHGGWERPQSYDPPGPPHDPWGPWIRDASRRFDVPERWIREVMRQESGGRAGATSPVGAMGLMQVMPATYRELRARHGLGNDPYHPYDSIMAGTAYIREMYDLYGSPAFLAAYNAGPRRLEDYLWNGRGLPTETRNYVRRIGPNIARSHPNRRVAPEIYAAAEIPTDIPPGPRRMDQATMLALREQRQAADPGIQVAQLPPGPVTRMEPIPDGSTYASPAAVPSATSYQVASLGGVVRMDPIPDGSTYGAAAPPPIPAAGGTVVRMDPIPDGSTPEGAARLAAEADSGADSSHGGSRLGARGRSSGMALAAPVGRANAAPSAPAARQPAGNGRTQYAAASLPSRPAPQPAPASRGGFGLMPSAQAASLGNAPAARPAAAGGNCGVQVGAYGKEAQARSAAASARDSGGGRVLVQPVAQGRTTLYRARVTGLSQPAAQQLCDKMRRNGGCTVLQPDS